MGKIAKTQHTPGQWRIASSDECKAMNSTMAVVTDTQSGIIVVANVWKTNDKIPSIDRDPQAAANARLIAAAPELLEACKELVQSLEVEKKRSGIVCFGFEAAKAAILKVEEGVKSEKRKAFFVSEIRTNDHGEYIALIAVEGESGFYVTDWCWGKDFKVAQDIADERNARLGLSKKEAAVIVCSTMRSVKMPEADDEVSHE
ncbi:MAG: hypothetical protein PHG80_12675 [Methanoregulaceae archaeon]|nr:hypothetical protein [Methanoregulaceae archaeon]